MAERRGPSDKSLISFNSGELSPFLDSRSDVEKVGSGCRTLENMIVDTSGEVFRRPGTKMIDTVGTPAVNPSGPPGIAVIVNRTTTTDGSPLGPKLPCVKLILTFELTYLTIIGHGCLCGYDEYDDGSGPSAPPKKLRKRTFSEGTMRFEYSNDPTGCPCTSGYDVAELRGFNEYDAITCVLSFSSNYHREFNGFDCSGPSFSSDNPIAALEGMAWGSADYQYCVSVVTKTQRKAVPSRPGCAAALACYACHTGIWCSVLGDTLFEDLSDEDTMFDALIRGIHTAGTGYETFVTTFDGAFCYTDAQAVRFQMLIHFLTVDCTYDVKVDYDQTIGGVTTSFSVTTTFVAETEDETFTFDVPVNPDGTVTPTTVTLSVH